MLFNSFAFVLLFLPLTLLVFYLLLQVHGRRMALLWLIVSSFIFYGWWNPAYVGLLGVSIAFNYLLGMHLSADGRSKVWIWLGVALNIALLLYYKYTDFFLGSLNSLAGTHIPLQRIVLPLAISFFTFQQIGFLVDAYRGKVEHRGILEYLVFVVFYPQLIAGPIVQHKDVVGQFAALPRYVDWNQVAQGITLFSIGLFKKVIVADGLSPWADRVFDAAAAGVHLGLLDAWGGVIAYALQLYFDFSGYSDMALGLGHMFGIRLPMNFDAPYRSRSIAEFWRRWHMTLGNFVRDYIYIPLGGNRHGLARTIRNSVIAMVLIGAWHGAGWTFVLWGLLHGIFMAIDNLWHRTHLHEYCPKPLRGPVPSWIVTFLAVLTGWVLFRAGSMPTAIEMYRGMLSFGTWQGVDTLLSHRSLAIILLTFSCSLAMPNAAKWVRGDLPHLRFETRSLTGLAAIALLVIAIGKLGHVSPFLYFNF